jgi:hypothetical protein
LTLIKKKITEVESIVNQADKRKTAGKIYLPKDWIGKKVKTVLLSSLILMTFVVLMASPTAAIAKKHQPTQAVGTPSAGNDQPTSSSPTDDGKNAPTDNGKNAPTINERIDIFIHGKKHHNSNHHSNSVAPKTTEATYITGTLVDCNVVFATPNYFSTLAINACNKQYGEK